MTDCDIEQAVILAGGRGSRLGSITKQIPKPLLPINGSPFLGHLFEQLADQGCKQVLVLVGYLADQIKRYCGDGDRWGLQVECIESPMEAETGQRLRDALPRLDRYFLMMYCDNYLPINLSDLHKEFALEPDAAMLTVYSNLDGYTRNNVFVDSTGYVTKYDPTRSSSDLNGVEVGYSIIPRKALSNLSQENVPFSHSVYPKLASNGLLRSYLTNHRYYSIGSPQRLSLTKAFLKPQKAVILDRDGTLNVRPPRAEYVTSWSQFNWLPGAIKSLQLLKKAGYKLILASNQPGIARGVMTESDLTGIHHAMAKDLEKHNVKLDAIYYCPHAWDDGCFCRKPSPGLLFEAQRDFHLDLTKTLFIGDDVRDKQAGELAGCLTGMVSEDTPLIRVVQEFLSSQSL